MGENNFVIVTVRVAIISQRWHNEACVRATQPVDVEHMSVETACLYVFGNSVVATQNNCLIPVGKQCQ